MPADKDIAEHIEDAGHGTVATDMFVGFMPDSPDNCVVVTQTGGTPPEVTVDLEYPGVQVRVRNTSQATGKALMNTIYKLLHQVTNTTIEARLYHSILATQSPSYLGKDQKNRALFVCNFKIVKAAD